MYHIFADNTTQTRDFYGFSLSAPLWHGYSVSYIFKIVNNKSYKNMISVISHKSGVLVLFDYSRFEELRAQKGVTKKFIADKLHRAPAICTDWKLGKSSPNQDQMRIIADVLDTTVEYLDGQTDQKEKPSGGVPKGLDKLIEIGKRLSDEQLERFIALMESVVEGK